MPNLNKYKAYKNIADNYDQALDLVRDKLPVLGEPVVVPYYSPDVYDPDRRISMLFVVGSLNGEFKVFEPNDDIIAHIDSSYNAMENYVDTADSSLQGQINDIVASQTSISLSGSPSVIYAATNDQTVSLSSKITTIGTISSHKILKGSTIISSGTGSNLNGSDSSTNATNDITYTAESIINGVKVTKNSTVYVRYPIYFGASSTWDSINNDAHKASARISPVGTYRIIVSQNGHSVFFNVPSEMSITKATVNGFDMPFKSYVSKTIDGKTYKSYESANTYTTSTFDVVIVS
jgi:hypothetical protein